MDEGLPIAYAVLDEGVPVYSSDGKSLGIVEHVVAAQEQDIFHGIVLHTTAGSRFVEASQVASLHERGVDLCIDASAAAALPLPEGAAPAWRLHEPGIKPTHWRHLVDRLEGANPKPRDWTRD
jgi:hypothetical protein